MEIKSLEELRRIIDSRKPKKNFEWQPFATAPKTGQSVLTERGFVLYLDHDMGLRKGWYYLDDINSSNSDGECLEIEDLPSYWIELPPLPGY